MADEIPENVDLRFLATQNARILRELAQAAISADLKITKEKVESIDDRLETIEGRMNTVERRLARIEEHTGLVKA
jgi:hypothetical protein